MYVVFMERTNSCIIHFVGDPN